MIFSFQSNSNNRKYGTLNISSSNYKYTDENQGAYFFSHYLSVSKNILQNWRPPLIQRLRSKRALPDYISNNESVAIFSENGYQKLAKTLNKGVFIPALVEETDEKIYFYQFPILNFLDVLDPFHSTLITAFCDEKDPNAKIISLQQLLDKIEAGQKTDPMELYKVSFWPEINQIEYPFNLFMNKINVFNNFFGQLCSLQFKNLIEELGLTGFSFRPINYLASPNPHPQNLNLWPGISTLPDFQNLKIIDLSENSTNEKETISDKIHHNIWWEKKYPTVKASFLPNPDYLPDEAQIQKIEQQYGFRFPEDYREYLLKYNSPFALPDIFITPYDIYELLEFEVLGPDGIKQDPDCPTLYEDSPMFFVIARTPVGGDRLYMFLEGPHKGKIYFGFHDADDPNDYDNLDDRPGFEFIANSFSEFLNCATAIHPEENEFQKCLRTKDFNRAWQIALPLCEKNYGTPQSEERFDSLEMAENYLVRFYAWGDESAAQETEKMVQKLKKDALEKSDAHQ